MATARRSSGPVLGRGVEVRSSAWALRSLWSAKEPVKCTVPLVDTVLMAGGDPLWLFTSKAGEVRKKKLITAEAIAKQFLSSVRQRGGAFPGRNLARRVAVLRFGEGAVTVLDDASFADLMAQGWPVRGTGLEAVQAFVASGGSGGCQTHRHRYRLRDDKGRVLTSALTFSLVPPHLTSSPG